MKLAGKSAVVTGAGRGIGRAVALALAREGAGVAALDVSADGAAQRTADDIVKAGGAAFAIDADVRDLARHAAIVAAAVERFGRLDILVNNAGLSRRQPFLEATEEAWDLTMGVNLKGAYFLAQAAARHMAGRGSGKIINIGSVHDTRPMSGSSIYGVSKGGLTMLTRCLAFELAPHRIQVNSISPGAILTDENRGLLADPEFYTHLMARIPSGRIGAVEEIAASVVYLASSDADYITGTTLYVDGGLLIG